MTVPTHPSNRTFINRMKEWGWIARTKSGSIEMTWPETGEKVMVYGPAHHKGNSAETFNRVAKITCGGLTKFWDEDLTEVTVVVEPFVPAKKRGSASPNRGLSKQILECLVAANNTPMTSAQIGLMLGVETSAAAGSLAYLVEKGHALRVLAGQYVAAPDRRPDRTVRHEVTGGATATVALPPAALAAPDGRPGPGGPPVAPAPVAAATGPHTAAPVSAPAPALEADVDEVRALLLPERIRFADVGRINEMRAQIIEFLTWVNRP